MPTPEVPQQTQSQRETTKFYKDFAANGGELYLTEIRRFAVGLYDPMVDSLVQSIPFDAQKPILDLGCGVGNIEEQIFSVSSDADITCVDNTQEMIRAAEERLAASPTKPTFICQDILTLQPDRKFGTVISNLAIHNLSLDEKKRILEKIKTWLEQGGTFVWGDFMEFEDTAQGQKIMKERKQNILMSDGANTQFVEEILKKESEDVRLTVNHTIHLLEKIGFKNSKVVWHKDFLAVVKCTI